MNPTRAVSLVILCGAALGSISCGMIDAWTGASPKSTKKVELPPPGGEYEVIGVLPGLESFAVKYDERLYRGGLPVSEAAGKSLDRLGVKTIVSITPTDKERALCAGHGFKLVELPFDKADGPSDDVIEKFVAVAKGADTPVYLHCHGGTHRGGVLGVAYRVHVLGWSQEKALAEYDALGGDLEADRTMLERVLASE